MQVGGGCDSYPRGFTGTHSRTWLHWDLETSRRLNEKIKKRQKRKQWQTWKLTFLMITLVTNNTGMMTIIITREEQKNKRNETKAQVNQRVWIRRRVKSRMLTGRVVNCLIQNIFINNLHWRGKKTKQEIANRAGAPVTTTTKTKEDSSLKIILTYLLSAYTTQSICVHLSSFNIYNKTHLRCIC